VMPSGVSAGSSSSLLLAVTPKPTVRPARAKPTATPRPKPTATPEPAWAPRQLTASLKGTGATFPNVLYQAWIQVYKKRVAVFSISYRGVGSGQAISDFIKYLTDFGGPDAAISQARVTSEAPDALHVPMVRGGVVPP